MDDYNYTLKVRSPYGCSLFAFAFFLFVVMLYVDTLPNVNSLPKLVAVFLGFWLFIMVVCLLKGTKETFRIHDGKISWLRSFPKSESEIALDGAEKIVVNDHTSCLRITFKSGQKKLRFVGRGEPICKYLEENYPSIDLEFHESSG